MKNLLLFFVLLIFAAPTHADEVTATHLKTLFTNILSEQQKIIAIDGTTTLNTKGDITVEEAGKYYAITLPHLSINDSDGGAFDIGIISINASPHDANGQWKMTIALPTPLRITNADTAETIEIHFRSQKASGIFHEDIQQFSKFDAAYKNVKIGRAQNTLNIGNITIKSDMEPDENNRWSGPATIALRNITTGTGGTKSKIKIDGIMANFLIDQLDPAMYLQHKNTILALHDQGAFSSADKISSATTQKLAASSFDAITKGMNGFSAKYAISGIDLTNRKGEKSTIKNTEITVNAGGFLESNKMNFGLGIKYDGFDASSMEQSNKNIIPSKADIGINIKNIPYIELTKIGQNTLAARAKDEDIGKAIKMASIGLMFKLPAILSQAGTSIEIKDNMIGNALYTLALNGNIRADINAAKSATANITALFTGLDALMNTLSTTIQDPESTNIGKFTKLYDRLERFKSFATSEGKDNYKIDFTLNEQGEMLLNGQDALTAFREK
ncbi:MAG: hypothetical protein ACRBCT_08975 [Alphaproteobacteria bacterium]